MIYVKERKVADFKIDGINDYMEKLSECSFNLCKTRSGTINYLLANGIRKTKDLT